MPETSNSVLAALRDQIDKKHADALKALDTLKVYLAEALAAAPEALAPAILAPAPKVDGLTKVQRVLDSIRFEFKTAEEISAEASIEVPDVRAVLYAKSVRDRIEKKKIHGRLAFKQKSGEAHASQRATGSPSAASLVRELIAQRPKGVDAGEIAEIIGPALDKAGIGRPAIGAALYNMKKHKKIGHSEATGLYFPLRQNGEVI